MRSGLEGAYVRFNKRYQEWEVLTNNHIVTAAFREEKDANFWASLLSLEAEIQSDKEGNTNTLGTQNLLGEHINERLYSEQNTESKE